MRKIIFFILAPVFFISCFRGTPKENTHDAMKKGRLGGQYRGKEFCKHGHPRSEFGVLAKQSRGVGNQWVCRACSVAKTRAYRARKLLEGVG